MSGVYDDQQEQLADQAGQHDDLGVHPERREAEVDDLEDQYAKPAYNPAERVQRHAAANISTPEELAEAEEEAGEDDDEEVYEAVGEDEANALNYTGDSNGKGVPTLKEQLKTKDGRTNAVLNGVSLGSLFKGKRKWIWAGVGGGGFFLILIAILIFFLASLKIENFAQHITTWNMVRVARTFRLSATDNIVEKAAVDSVDETVLQRRFPSLISRYSEKLDQFRANKLFNKMKAAGFSEPIIEEQPRRLFPGTRQVVTGWRVGGEEIAGGNQRYGRLFSNYNERIRFAAQMDANFEKGVRGYRTIVRGSVARKLRADVGIKLHWWERLGKGYRGLKAEEADRLAQKEALSKVKQPVRADSVDDNLNRAANNLDDSIRECVDDTSCADDLIKSEASTAGQSADNALPEAIAGTVSNINRTATQSVLGAASLAYTIGVPVCMIHEGSVEESGGTVDDSSNALQATYYSVTTAADQQKAGDTTGEAVGSMNRKMGNIANTIPEQRAYGREIDTELIANQNPQASRSGQYSIFNVLLGGGLGDTFGSVAGTACPIILNPLGGVAVAIAELGLSAWIGGGAGTVAGQGARATLTAGVAQIGGKIVAEYGSYRLFARSLATKIIVQGAAIGAATLISRLLVVNYANAQYTGVSRDDEFAVEADMGANIHANELERQMFAGRPMTPTETVASRAADLAYMREQNSQKSSFERYFALNNPDSLLTTFGMTASSNFSTWFSKPSRLLDTISGSLDITKGFGNMLAFGGNDKVSAATYEVDKNYRIAQWDWPQSELNILKANESYTPLTNAETFERDPRKDEVINKYEPCFTKTVGELFADKKIKRNEDGSVKDDDSDCSPKMLGVNNPQYGDLVFRYRLTIRNENTIDHLTEIQNAENTTRQTTQTAAGNANIYVIGDSLTAGMQGQGKLQEKLSEIRSYSGITINGAAGRSLVRRGSFTCCGNPGSSLQAFDQIAQTSDQEVIKDADTILVGLGTNDSGTDPTAFKTTVAEFATQLRQANSNAVIYWINLYSKDGSGPSYPALNTALQEAANTSNLHIIDWASVAPSFYPANNLHPVGHYEDMANFVVCALPAPSGTSSSGSGCSTTTPVSTQGATN